MITGMITVLGVLALVADIWDRKKDPDKVK